MSIVSTFYIDYLNSGETMWLAIESEDVESCEKYLQQYSNDVRFCKQKERGKLQNGCRLTPVGMIVASNIIGDKYDTFGRDRNVNGQVDSRHSFL